MIHLRAVPRRQDFQLIENQRAIKADLLAEKQRQMMRGRPSNDDECQNRPWWAKGE